MIKGYHIGDAIKNAMCLIYTKVFWKKARLVRLPVLARNRANIHYGEGFTCGVGCRLNPGTSGRLSIGKNFIMGDQCQIEAMKEVTIGNNVLLASKVYIGDASHGDYNGADQSSPNEPPHERIVTAKSIKIGDNVWIGNAANILGGIEIGNGSSIGANSVVTSSIPDNCIAVGCPAKAIKKYDYNAKKWKLIKL